MTDGRQIRRGPVTLERRPRDDRRVDDDALHVRNLFDSEIHTRDSVSSRFPAYAGFPRFPAIASAKRVLSSWSMRFI